jgi:hypothetical protein
MLGRRAGRAAAVTACNYFCTAKIRRAAMLHARLRSCDALCRRMLIYESICAMHPFTAMLQSNVISLRVFSSNA